MLKSLARWLGLADPPSSNTSDLTSDHRGYLRRHVWQYPHLSASACQRVEEVVAQMLAQRRWTGGSGFEVTEEMRTAIAGQAALFSIGLDRPYGFPYVSDIIVYPKPFFVPYQQASRWSSDPIFGGASTPRDGEAWQHGPIVLAWSSIAKPYDKWGGYMSVVAHEFAHHLDGLDGDMSGAPPIDDSTLKRDWYRVTELDYLELVGRATRDEPALLDHYGASNPAEFFAVATECFFNRPHDLREQHTHLYDVLARYYRQSPADYLPRSAVPPARLARSTRRRSRSDPRVRKQYASDPFAAGIEQVNDDDFAAAIESFTKAIAADPADGEAYTERAHARFHLQQYQRALADAERALELDAADDDALAVRGVALVRLDRLEEGIAALRRVSEASEGSMTHAHLGYAYLKQGDAKLALRHLDIAVALDAYDCQTYRWRAEAYSQLGNQQSADEDLQRAARLDPHG